MRVKCAGRRMMAYEIGGRADKYGNRFELMLKSKHMCLANTDLRFHLYILLRQRKKPEYMREKTTMPVSVRGWFQTVLKKRKMQ